MEEHPVLLIKPAAVAETVVRLLATPVVTVGVVLTPEPVAATLMDAAPPPSTTIFPLYDKTADGVKSTNISCEKAPPGCGIVNEAVNGPPALVEKLNPVNALTVTSALVRSVPVMVNELGPAPSEIHTFPKSARVPAVRVGIAAANVVKVCSGPYAVPPLFVA